MVITCENAKNSTGKPIVSQSLTPFSFDISPVVIAVPQRPRAPKISPITFISPFRKSPMLPRNRSSSGVITTPLIASKTLAKKSPTASSTVLRTSRAFSVALGLALSASLLILLTPVIVSDTIVTAPPIALCFPEYMEDALSAPSSSPTMSLMIAFQVSVKKAPISSQGISF